MKFCLFAILCPFFLFAQGIEGQLSKNQIRIDLLLPGVAFERAITKNMSIVLDSHFGAASIGEKAKGDDKIIGMQTVSIQHRYYLNLERRLAKGRSTLTNSGLYSGLIVEQSIYYGKYKATLLSKSGVLGGFQQTFHNGFNINAAGGAGYTDGIDYSAKIRPLIKLSFGIVLGAKKKYKHLASLPK